MYSLKKIKQIKYCVRVCVCLIVHVHLIVYIWNRPPAVRRRRHAINI